MIACSDCKGRGRWAEREIKGDETIVEVKFCNTCNGNGYIVPADEEDVYDIDGEDDDDV